MADMDFVGPALAGPIPDPAVDCNLRWNCAVYSWVTSYIEDAWYYQYIYMGWTKSAADVTSTIQNIGMCAYTKNAGKALRSVEEAWMYIIA